MALHKHEVNCKYAMPIDCKNAGLLLRKHEAALQLLLATCSSLRRPRGNPRMKSTATAAAVFRVARRSQWVPN
jgi:hypothetical protein